MNSEIEKIFWEKTNKYISVLQIVPFLKMVSVCNNLAFGNVDEESDIDLFIVAKKGRLFLVRIFVTFILHFLGVRRHGNKVSSRFCLSFFVDEEGLNFSMIALKNDVYLAYWICSMVPLINDGIVDKFLNENVWAKNYFENVDDFRIKTDRVLKNKWIKNVLRKFLEFVFNGRFGDFVENRLKKWQLRRANKKAKMVGPGASIVVSDHILKFHNVDKRSSYREKWINKYGVSAKLTKERFLSL